MECYVLDGRPLRNIALPTEGGAPHEAWSAVPPAEPHPDRSRGGGRQPFARSVGLGAYLWLPGLFPGGERFAPQCSDMRRRTSARFAAATPCPQKLVAAG